MPLQFLRIFTMGNDNGKQVGRKCLWPHLPSAKQGKADNGHRFICTPIHICLKQNEEKFIYLPRLNNTKLVFQIMGILIVTY